MRYIKVLLLVLLFFLSMIFFFQNQESLSQDMVLKLNLFFIEPMSSIPLPFYFVVLTAFLLGALMAFLILVWDKVYLSAQHLKALWHIRALEKELATLKGTPEPVPAPAPKNTSLFARKNTDTPAPTPPPVLVAEDIKAPDPDKNA